MAEQSGEKSFEATPHRREQAREKGQVPYSQDLGSAILLLAGAGLLKMFGASLATSVTNVMRRLLSEPLQMRGDDQMFLAMTGGLMQEIGGTLSLMLLMLVLAAVATSVAQVGFLFVPDKVAPDISRLNPISGLQRLFSSQAAARLGFGLFKVLIVAVVSVAVVWRRSGTVLEAAELDMASMAKLLIDVSFETVFWVGGALLTLALGDLFFQRWKHEQDLRMTAQEMKEEMKNLQGNPEVAARRRQVQRQMALERMGEAVPKADVVVTNPTELAIALKYDIDSMAAPIVLAKGAGVIAQRIRRLALENGIPIVERKPLAQLLYKEVEINQPIPADAYTAVAEVLAYVYQLQGKKPPQSVPTS